MALGDQNLGTLQDAFEHHLDLLEDGYLSMATNVGTVAILYAATADHGITEQAKDAINMRNMAHDLADKLLAAGRGIEIAHHATRNDFVDILQNPTYSDIILIAHGSIGNVFLEPETPQLATQNFDWTDISAASTHLLTGGFTQITCAQYPGHDPPNNVQVPLGTFAVADQTFVVAPIGQSISPDGLDHPDMLKLQQVYEEPLNFPGSILALQAQYQVILEKIDCGEPN